MKDKHNNFMRLNLSNISGYFSKLMAFVYVMAGVYLIFFYPDNLSLNKTLKISMGFVIILYGFYRIYRVFYSINEDNEN